ncbi:MAG: pyrroline-5-carboxylate reductase [Pseudomonadota bacterium]
MDSAPGPLVLFGAGNMGGAMAAGWLAGAPKDPPWIVDPKPSAQVAAWASAGRIVLNPAPQPAGILVIAVKPQMFDDVLPALRAWTGAQTLALSIMAGVSLARLTESLGTPRCLRVMPNTPGAIGKGVALMSPSPACTERDVATARALLSPLGHVEGPMDEATLQAATGLSGCGPAYVFLLAEVLAAAAEDLGVPAEMATRLAAQTVEGSAALMAASDAGPGELRRAVTSPRGVTEAALQVLMADGAMPSLFSSALQAALDRDAALSAGDEDKHGS